MDTRFSDRTAWELGENSYSRAVRDAHASGRPVLDLTVSNPTRCGFTYDPGVLLSPLGRAESLTYDPQPLGLLTAREAMVQYYAGHGAVVSAAQLALTASTSESYSFLFRLLCNPGDEVLIAQPSYPLFDFLATLDDVRLQPYPLFFDHGWWIDFAELERRITTRTRAVVVVHPNNPTGHWTREAERRRLEQLCEAHGLALIVDEVFLDYLIVGNHAQGTSAQSFACGPHPVLTFVLSGLSKIAGLPQMKAAWIAALGPQQLLAEAMGRLEVIADTFLSVSAPVQMAIPPWLASRGAIQQQILDRVRHNLALLERFASKSPDKLRVIVPEAGWAAVVSLPSCGGDPGCAERLVREHGVVVHPGAFYGMAERNRAVISLLTEPTILNAALELL